MANLIATTLATISRLTKNQDSGHRHVEFNWKLLSE